MARSSREQTARTLATIKSRAREALGDGAYATLSLDAVAAAAGVTRGAVYHHFGSKEGLFRVLLEEEMRRVARAIDEATGAGELNEQVRRGCAAFLRATQDPVIRRIVLVDGPAVIGWREWRELDARVVRRSLDEGLAELARAGALRGDWPAASVMLSGALNEAAMWLADDPEARIDDAVALVDAWVAALTPGPGG